MSRLRTAFTVAIACSVLAVPGPVLAQEAPSPTAEAAEPTAPLPDPGPPSLAPEAPGTFVPAPAPTPSAGPAGVAVPVPRTYTPYSETVANADGTRTATVYGTPTFRQVNGVWRRIDPRLHEAVDATYPFEVDDGAAPLRLGRSRDALAQFALPDGAVTIALRGDTADRAPRRAGQRLRYDDVAAGVDLDVTFPNTGVRIDHVIAGPASPHRFRYHLSDPNGVLGMPVVDPDGSIRFVGTDVRIEPPVAYERGTTPDVTEPSAHHSIVAAGDGYDLEEWVDEDWLAGKTYPIVLDPTVTLTGGTGSGNTDCEIANGGQANAVACAASVAQVGYGTSASGNVVKRALFQFPFDTIPAGSAISAATLSLLYTGFTGTAGTETVNVYKILPGELWSNASWNNRITNAGTIAWNTAGGSPTGTAVATRAIPTTTTVNTRLTWDVLSLVQTVWADSAPGQNRGMLLRSTAESTTRTVKFATFQDTTAADRPELVVTYTPPTAPVVQVVSRDSSAFLSWVHGMDNGARTGYRIRAFESVSGIELAPIQVGSTVTSTTFPGLTNGVLYYFKVEPLYEAGTGEVATTSSVVPHAAPTVTASITSPSRAGAAGVYARGQQLRLQAVVTSRESVTAPHTVTVNLPVLGASGTVTVGGAACTGGVSCTIGTHPDGLRDQLTVSGLQLGAGASQTITVDFLPPGSDRACQALSFALDDVVGTNVLDGAGAVATASPIAFRVCDGGLGKEDWFSYLSGDVGPFGNAAVNVANGNLVLQQADTTPVQVHGALSLFTRRTYNSQDTTLVALPGTIGNGWVLNVGSLAGIGGDLVTPAGLAVPPLVSTLTNPLALTLVDRDGTRHRFTPRVTQLGLNAASTGSGLAQSLLDGSAPSGKVHCVDVAYQAPPGVELSVYRYLLGDGTTCAGATGLAVAGFVAQRPDRLRTLFDATGRLLAMVDGSGNRLDYTYTSGRLTQVAERLRPGGTAGRAVTLTYHSTGVHTTCGVATYEVRITDPAARVTRYCLDGDPNNLSITAHLLRVVNPDGGRVDYRYHGVAALDGVTGACSGSTGQLCSVSNEQSTTVTTATSFTYSATDTHLSTLPRVATVTDRRGKVTNVGYHYDASYVDTDRYDQRTRWTAIDAHGRVGEILSGAVNGSGITAARHSVLRWDTTGSGATRCRQPDDALLHHDLCSVTRKTLSLHTAYTSQGFTAQPDQLVEYLYNPEGMLLRERRHTANGGTGDVAITTTYGYAIQSISSTGALTCYRDTIAGGGNVTVGTAPTTCDSSTATGGTTGTRDADVLLAVVDQVESLTPRGNAAGTDWTNYRTTVDVDADPGYGATSALTTSPCTSGTRSNTGLVCSAAVPRSATLFSTTSHEYDSYGQRTKTTNPRGHATTYSYYGDADEDLSDSTSAGGWLKAVTDARGKFVVFAYDAAGNVVRTWDRNATAGTDPDDYASLSPAPPSLAYTETLHQALPGSGKTSYNAPWRWVVSEASSLLDGTARAEHRATYTVDRNGNVLTSTPPRGNSGYSNTGTGNPASAYTTTQTFDAGDLRTTVMLPESSATEATSQPASQFFYDDYGRLDYEKDPLGHVRDHVYDSVNRLQYSYVERGVMSDTTAVSHATGCGDGASWTPAPAGMPSGALICRSATTLFNGQDQPYLTSDPLGYYTYRVFDGAGRRTQDATERIGGGPSSAVVLRVIRVFDVDGNVLRECTPRAVTEDSNTNCAAPARFGTTYTYTTGGLVQSAGSFRGEGLTTGSSFLYDANGNRTTTQNGNGYPTVVDYDVLDRPVCVRRQRSSTETVYGATEYDAAGHVIKETRLGGTTACPTEGSPTPTGRLTQYTYDTANRLVDTIDNPGGGESVEGGSDVQTRLYYDADSNVIATAEPRAFASGAPSATSPYITRVDFDEQGRRMTAYAPRTDSTTTPPALTDTAGQAIDDQTAECPGSVTGYATATRVCITRLRYDVGGNLVRMWLPSAGGATTGTRHVDYVYTHDNQLKTTTTPTPTGSTGAATTAQYRNGRGEVVATVNALGRTTSYEYNGDGKLTEVTAPPNGSVTHVRTLTYDVNGNVLTDSGFDGVTRTNTYYYDDLLWTTKTPNDRPGAAPDPAGDVRTMVYDGVGNVIEVTSPAANAANGSYPDAAASETVPTRIWYTHDDLPLTTVAPVSPNGVTKLRRTTYGYDTGGRATSETVDTVSDSGVNVQSYTSTSTAVTKTTAYYKNDRVKSATGTDTTSQLQFKYDLAGNLTEASDPSNSSATVAAAYYLDGLPRHVDAGGRRTAYLYDGNGQVVARAHAPLTGGTPGTFSATRYSYDDAGAQFRMRSPVAESTSTGDGETTWEFDLAGQLTERIDPNGAVATYVRANDDTLTSVDVTVGGTSVSKWQYTYDGGYRVVTAAQSGRTSSNATFGPTTSTFTYSPAGRLASFAMSGTTQYYEWDHNGNRLCAGVDCKRGTIVPTGTDRTRWSYNADDSVAQERLYGTTTLVSYAYGTTGLMRTDGQHTYCYDAHDRLSHLKQNSVTTCPAASPTISYGYDAMGRQTLATAGAVSRTNHYDGTSATLVRSVTSTTTTDYGLSSSGTPMAVRDGAAAPQFMVDDGSGSVTSVLSAAGAVACQLRYDPFGERLNTNGTAFSGCTTSNDRWYGTSRRDDTTGQYRLGGRTYDPGNGTFLEPDQFGPAASRANTGMLTDPATANRYSFVNGDPVNLIDPSGHRPICRQKADADACPGFKLKLPPTLYDLLIEYVEARTDDLARCLYMSGGSGALCHGQDLEVVWDYYVQLELAKGCSVVKNQFMRGFCEWAEGTVAAVATVTEIVDTQIEAVTAVAHGDVDTAVKKTKENLGNLKDLGYGMAMGLVDTVRDVWNVTPLGFGVNALQHGVGEAKDRAARSLGRQAIPAVLTLLTLGASRATSFGVRTSAATAPTASLARGALSRGPATVAPRPIAVIGRQWDTAVAKKWAGHEVLDLPDGEWSIAANDAWVDSVIARKLDVYVGSNPTWKNLWDAKENRPTVFARELDQLQNAGYTWDGWILRPPGA